MGEQRKFKLMLIASGILCTIVVMTHVSLNPSAPPPHRRLGDAPPPCLEGILKKKKHTKWYSGVKTRWCVLAYIAADASSHSVSIPALLYYTVSNGTRDSFKGCLDL